MSLALIDWCKEITMKTVEGKYPTNERPKAIRIYYDMAKLKDYVFCRVYLGPIGNSEMVGNLCIPIGEWNWFKSMQAECYYIPDTATIHDVPQVELRD